MYSTSYWVAFFAIIICLLALDLGVFNKTSHEVKTKEALAWSGFWVIISLLFSVFIGVTHGLEDATLFLTAYALEKALSVDNLFVFILIFGFFKIDSKEHHKVLYWGIIGSLIMRGLFIYLGLEIISKLHWMLYVFGAFLVFSGIKAFFHKEDENQELSPLIKRLTKGMSPFIACLIAIELSDIVFAVDSVPAVLSVTNKPFIVYTSNIFAILGLRSLYFALSDLSQKLSGLKKALSFILVFIGAKMLLIDVIHFPSWLTLSLIIGAILFSLIPFGKKK